MSKVQQISDTMLKAVALGMAVATVVLGILVAASIETSITLLGIGLFALALVSLSQAKD